MWEVQRTALDGHDLLAPHLYSLGTSMDEWARRVAEQADGPLVAIGVSMGGYCAQPLLEDADERVVERARTLALEQDPEELVTGVAAMRDGPDSPELVRGTEAPVLVAVGELDPFFPAEEAEALAVSARNGRAQVFPGCGHLASLERPDEFNRVLLDFLSDV